MAQEEDINEEMKEIAPGFPVKGSFPPPAGYFETFPDEVLNRWKKEESQPVARIIHWKRMIAIAVVLTGLIIGGWWFFANPTLVDTNDITAVEAYQYIHENIDEFEPLLETADIEINESNLDIPSEAVEEYLIEETNSSDPEDLF